MGCLAKSKGPEIPIFNEEDEKILKANLNDLPKEELLCPKCGKVPEILNVHTDNGYIELKCKSHGKISMEIQKYKEELDKSVFIPKCYICKISQKDIEIYYCYECQQDLCENCKKDFDKDEVRRLKHKPSHLDTCIEAKEKNNRCLKHFSEEITEYCADCEENICEKERSSRHEDHNIIKISDYLEEAKKYCKIIAEKNKYLEQIRILNNKIKDNYTNYQNNYFYVKSMINTGKSLKEQSKRKPGEIECFLEELKGKKNQMKIAKETLSKNHIDVID